MNKPRWLSTYFMFFGLLNIFVISFAVGVVMLPCAGHLERHKSFVGFLIVANTPNAAVMVIYEGNILHVLADSMSIGRMKGMPLFFYPWRCGIF